MYKIATLNKIATCGTDLLKNYKVSSDEKNPEGIILRSFNMHEMDLPDSLLAVARAGAGTNNIPIDKCAEKGIVVFNTPGANANAVKEIVIASLLMSSRKIVDGINWVSSLAGQNEIEKIVEVGKANFVGPEIQGKKLGVIGLGAIGVMTANVGISLGMEVYGFDPFISIDAAWNLRRTINKAKNIEEIFATCDYITIHIPYTAENKNLFNKNIFAKTKKGLRLLNFSRGELVNNSDIKEAIKNEIISTYVTDFPSAEVVNEKGIIAIPHLGASTPESEDNCAVMAAQELKNYLEEGQIKNSVNFPNCELPFTGKKRLCIIHKNIPHMISSITTALADKSLNIDDMLNKSRGDFAYTIIDIDSAVPDSIAKELLAVNGVIKVRII
ncbi:MAG: phosphoglycerate dehydrogenase [Fusobacteriaceae bacterium]